MKFNIKTDLPNAFLNAAIITVLILGIAARLYIAKIEAGAHEDDIYLLSNAVFYSYYDLLTKPLQGFQVSPFFHVLLLKFLYENFGLNNVILRGGVSLLSSCFALFLFPLTVYKVCKNKFAVLISLSLLSFNWYSLYYAQRLKQYSTDIFLTIFLIWLGYKIFSKSISKIRMVYFTVICITCALFSYTAIILIACLMFYYLFLFKKDNIKAKTNNFLIFIIPWLLIFIPYMVLIGIHNIHNPGQISYWNYYSLSNFEQFREMILYLFGHENYYSEMEVHSFFTFSENFWYIFVPILIGIITIFIKKDKYLFCVLILPVIISQLLGMAYIYPIGPVRISLWLLPIFIILFVLPSMFINFNLMFPCTCSLSFSKSSFKKSVIFFMVSIFIIIYYLWIYHKPSVTSIQIYLEGFPFGRAIVFRELIDEFKKSDITDNDIIVLQSGLGHRKLALDMHKEFTRNLKIEMNAYKDNTFCNEGIIGECKYSKLLLLDKNMYFYLFREFYDTEAKYEWIKQNMNVIYEYETWNGDKFIKARSK